MSIINWGIIGPGKIARKFADDLRLVPGARLHAVASSSAERARAFADQYGAPHAYGSYEAIVGCPDLDIVYVATPHVFHYEHTMMCLENGLSVLCEKPFAMHAGQARKMIETARRKKVFLMEALWTRFIPAVDYALALIEQGEIGDVHTVKADFGYYMPFDAASRVYNKALGGGSLLDIGIYPMLLSQFVFGKPLPENIQAAATFTETRVDESCMFTFQFPDNKLAFGHSTVFANTPVEASILGRDGNIYLHPRWHHTQKLTISEYEGRDERRREVDFPYEGWGYSFEAAHVVECLRNSQLESDRVPLDFTLDLCETLDAVRGLVGLEY